jgi:internalin A
MKTKLFHIRPLILILIFLVTVAVSTLAQEVSIPDSGLDAAIREALQIPDGPLTERDLLSLTVLEARSRNVNSVEGLEAARNLVALDLDLNQLTSFSLPNALTNLETLDLSSNSLTNCSLSSGFTNLASLFLKTICSPTSPCLRI